MLTYFLAAAAVVALLYLLGLGLSLISLPSPSWAQVVIVSPWVGYTYAAFAAWNVYRSGHILTVQWVMLFALPAVVCLLVATWKGRLPPVEKRKWLPLLSVLAVTASCFGVISLALLKAHQGLTSVSLGNNDVALYAGVSRYLIEFPRPSAAGVNRMFTGIMDYNYFGAPAVSGIASVLLGLMPHQVSTLATNLLFALTAATAFLLLADVLRLDWKVATLGVALLGFHPLLLYVALHGFSSQIAGMGLSAMIFWAWIQVSHLQGVRRFTSGSFALLTIFTIGQLLTYQHMLPFLWFFIAVYAGFLRPGKRSPRAILEALIVNGAAFLVAAIFCPLRILALYETMHYTATAQGGWFLPYVTPDYLIGFVYQNIFLAPRPWMSSVVASTLVSAFLIALLAVAYRARARSLLATAVACLAIGGGALVLAINGARDGTIGGYKAFKLVSFFLPWSSAVTAAFFAFDLARSPGTARAIKVVILVAISHAYIIADNKLVAVVASDGAKVQPAYQDLLKVDADPEITSVNVLGREWWATMWKAYFLMHKQLSFETATYFAAEGLNGAYDLLDSRDLSDTIAINGVLQVHQARTLVAPPQEMGRERKLNDRFKVVKHVSESGDLSVQLGTGWHSTEGNHVWTGTSGRRSSLKLNAKKEMEIRLAVKYAAFQPDDTLTVTLDGQPLSTQPPPGTTDAREIDISRITLHEGTHELEFVSAREPAQAPNGDPRTLSHSFWAIDLHVL